MGEGGMWGKSWGAGKVMLQNAQAGAMNAPVQWAGRLNALPREKLGVPGTSWHLSWLQIRRVVAFCDHVRL